jgi:hypothetical protein
MWSCCFAGIYCNITLASSIDLSTAISREHMTSTCVSWFYEPALRRFIVHGLWSQLNEIESGCCHYSNSDKTACFKVTAKSYNVSTRTAEPRRVNTAQNLHRSKSSNAVPLTYLLQPRSKGGGKSFRVLEACNLVTATTVLYSTAMA